MKIRWGSMIPFSTRYTYGQKDIEDTSPDSKIPTWAWALGGIGVVIIGLLIALLGK